MLFGERLRSLRIQKQLSQLEIRKRTGLAQTYLSRIENCHVVPALENIQKIASALDLSMADLFRDVDENPSVVDAESSPRLVSRMPRLRRQQRQAEVLNSLLPKIGDRDRQMLVSLARKLVMRNPQHESRVRA